MFLPWQRDRLAGQQVRLDAPQHLLVTNRAAFKAMIAAAVAAGAPLVVVDLAGCSYVDSSGLGMLLAEKKAANRHGSDVVLEHVPADLAEMMEITRLDRAFAAVDAA